MRACLDETARRRERQRAYNEEHGITPQTIRKAVRDLRPGAPERDYLAVPGPGGAGDLDADAEGDVAARVDALRAEMLAAAEALEFERAAELRDRLLALRGDSGPVTATRDRRGGAGGGGQRRGARPRTRR
jgi:excinuclease ABC subunit B